MARDYKQGTGKAEKQGSGLGGGPVGNAGGYSGRPGAGSRPTGSRPSGPSNPPRPSSPRPSSPRPSAPRPSTPDSQRAPGQPTRGAGSNGLLLAGLAYLLLGRKKGGNGQNGGNGKGGIIRLVIIAAIAIFVLKSCGGSGSDVGYQSFSSGNSGSYNTVVATPAPTPRPTPKPTPKPTPAPTPAQQFSNQGSYTGSFGSNSWFANSGNSFGSSTGSSSSGSFGGLDLSSLFGGTGVNSGTYSASGWVNGSNCGQLNTSVLSGARAKYTSLRGNGNDVVTIMVYMCGTDLESNYGMGTNDLQEMASAAIANNVNLIVYTGGCTGWKNNLMSSSTNQIYKIENGGQFVRLVDDAGNKPMVDPSTLSGFIQFCAKNYPADRNMLIFWDHGGGSLSGYGYDQRFKSSGSMTLDEIDQALRAGGTRFDFIGFDACLMATVETAQVASRYADYMIASEESEPGIGWYYTNWLNLLSRNTSTPTLTLGKQIVDDFVDTCAKKCAGQDTTLSVTDLAEFELTVPQLLNSWADSTVNVIKSDYKSVSSARGSAKEFAADSKIDQVDLANLAYNLNNSESQQLASAILSAVKYNRTSSTVKNAYGLSAYFPYRSKSSVKTAVSTYSKLGLDASYSKCVQAYATYATSGQSASYGNGYSSYSSGSSSSGSYGGGDLSSVLGSLLGSYTGSGSSYGGSNYGGTAYGSGYGGSSYSSSYDSSDLIYTLLGSMLGGGRSLPNTGLSAEDSSFIADTFNAGTLDARSVADYVYANTFDASALNWGAAADGSPCLSLPQQQWDLVSELKLSLFRDDGAGFIDLGLDLYDGFFNADGSLSGLYDGGWLGINGHEVAYYQLYTVVDGENIVTVGRVPCLYNGVRANLLVETVNDVPNIVGVCYDYLKDADINTYAKSVTEYNSSDTVQFIADYYTYENVYQDTYKISDVFTLADGLTADYILVPDPQEVSSCYRFTDIYGQEYWSPVLTLAA